MFYKVAAGVGAGALVAIAGVMGWQAWQGRNVEQPLCISPPSNAFEALAFSQKYGCRL